MKTKTTYITDDGKELFFKHKDKVDDELNKRKILKLEQELKVLRGEMK